MFHFQIPRGKDLLTWSPVIAVLMGLAGVMVWRSSDVFWRYRDIRAERIKLEEKARSLEAEGLALEREIRELGTPEAIERLAKEKLGLKKPGEEVAVVVLKEEKPISVQNQEGFWERIWSLITGLLGGRTAK